MVGAVFGLTGRGGSGAVFDRDGQLLSGSMGDYAVPRASDIPLMVLDHAVTQRR
jgi:CO/xanthine dehydrogenase Mo-binding subunit